MAAFGVSFIPGQNGEPDETGAATRAPADRVQEAIRILSLRLPRVVGGGALAPAPLLQGMGGQGSPAAQGIQSFSAPQSFPGRQGPRLPAPQGGFAGGLPPIILALLQMAGLNRPGTQQGGMGAWGQPIPSPGMPHVIPGLTRGSSQQWPWPLPPGMPNVIPVNPDLEPPLADYQTGRTSYEDQLRRPWSDKYAEYLDRRQTFD